MLEPEGFKQGLEFVINSVSLYLYLSRLLSLRIIYPSWLQTMGGELTRDWLMSKAF